ncbi:cytochrome c oxidase assembly factor [Scheffersomyces amazonensis]|uniref:cytochrome c oxidase assembly factor n=1 Tax=Scheffersomyces amazonensis TaxID=1078765 RepID=UPI00315D8143
MSPVTLLYYSQLQHNMSTASKITFAASCALAAGSFVFINYSQNLEREVKRQGPIKDAARIESKRQSDFSKKQLVNDAEHREQQELRDKLIKLQPLSDEIIRGEDKPSS